MRLPALAILTLLLAGCSAPAAELAPASPTTNVSGSADVLSEAAPAGFPCARSLRGSVWTSEDTHDAIADLGTIVKPEGIRGPDPVPRDGRVVAVRKALPASDGPEREPFFGEFEELFVEMDPFAYAYVEARFDAGAWTLAAHDLRDVDLAEHRATVESFVVNVTNATDAQAATTVDALFAASRDDRAGPVAMPNVTSTALRALAAIEAEEDRAFGFSGLEDGHESTAQVHDVELRYLVPRAALSIEATEARHTLSATERGELEIVSAFANASGLPKMDAQDLVRLVVRDVAPLDLPDLDERGVLDMLWREIDCGESDPKEGAPVPVTFRYDECAMAMTVHLDHDGVYAALPPARTSDGGVGAPASLGLPEGARVQRIMNGSRAITLTLVGPWWEGDGWALQVDAREMPRGEIDARITTFLERTTAANASQIATVLEALSERIATESRDQSYVYVEVDAPAPTTSSLDALFAQLGPGRLQSVGMDSAHVEFSGEEDANASTAPPGFIPWGEPASTPPWSAYVEAPLRRESVELDGGRLTLTAGAFGSLRAYLEQDAPASLARDEEALFARLKEEVLALRLGTLDESAFEDVARDMSCGARRD